MAIHYWWHNVTKEIWNESDIEDFIYSASNGDVILFSVSGNSLMNSLSKPNINK